MRVPTEICMPSGTVMRKIFLVSPAGSINAALATNWPLSRRASLTVRHTSLAAACFSLPQTFVHGVYVIDGASGLAWLCAGAAGG